MVILQAMKEQYKTVKETSTGTALKAYELNSMSYPDIQNKWNVFPLYF